MDVGVAGVNVSPKGVCRLRLPPVPLPPLDEVYSAIVKARGLVSRQDRCQESGVQAKLRRVLAILDLEYCEEHEALMNSLHEKMRTYLNTMRDSAIAAWKAKVKSWTSSTKLLYSYLKNPLPAKPLALNLSRGENTSHLNAMLAGLREYWNSIGSWPSENSQAEAAEMLEENYSLFLPHVPHHFTLSAATIHDTIKRMNRSSPGLDGWHLDELQLLPKSGWESHPPILEREPHSFETSSLSLYKRVAIEKSNTSIPPPNMIRPIDVYSVVLRAYTSAQAAMLRSWLKKVVHPCQYASSYGAVNMHLPMELRLQQPRLTCM